MLDWAQWVGWSVLLGGALVVAGAAKLRTPEAVKRSVVELGGPASHAGVIARVLPWVELGLGVGIVTARGMPQLGFAIAAGALLGVFAVLLARVARRGEDVDCACFGTLGASRVGWPSVGRNIGLVALASIVALGAGQGPSLGSLVGAGDLSGLAASTALLLAAFAGSGARARAAAVADELTQTRQYLLDLEHRMTRMLRGEDFDVRPVPAAPIYDHDGRLTSLREVVAETSAVLVFVKPGCGSCRAIAPQLPQWRAALGEVVPLHLVAIGEAGPAREAFPAEADIWTTPPGPRGAARALGVEFTPGAILLGAGGHVLSDPLYSPDQIAEMADEVGRSTAEQGT